MVLATVVTGAKIQALPDSRPGVSCGALMAAALCCGPPAGAVSASSALQRRERVSWQWSYSSTGIVRWVTVRQ